MIGSGFNEILESTCREEDYNPLVSQSCCDRINSLIISDLYGCAFRLYWDDYRFGYQLVKCPALRMGDIGREMTFLYICQNDNRKLRMRC